MISDVLHEAIEKIDWYLRELPDVYTGPTLGEVNAVRAAMRRLQARLDCPVEKPTTEEVQRN